MARRFIRWTDQEKALLSERARELMQSGTRSPLAALKKAQAVLPAQRRRKLLYMAQVPWFQRESATAKLRSAPAVRGTTDVAEGFRANASSPLCDTIIYFFAKLLREALEHALEGRTAPTGALARAPRARRRRRR